MPGRWDFGPMLSYAYHMNALKFADYLTELSVARGVTHHLDHVTNLAVDGGTAGSSSEQANTGSPPRSYCELDSAAALKTARRSSRPAAR